MGSVPGSERALEEGNGNPLHSCLRNPMDRGVRQVTVHGVTEVLDTTEHRVTASDLPLSPYSLDGRWGILLSPMVFKSVSVTEGIVIVV